MSPAYPVALHSRTQARLGTMLSGRWRLDAVLGVGGMGAVYEGVHRNGNRVAIKILHPELALDSLTLQRFLREGHLANAVEHPGVVRVLDDGATEEGLPFLVIELLEGESLDDRLTRTGRGLQVPDALAVGVAMLDVLKAAHEKGIIHRDLKPENVFLLSNGGIKLLDFGIAALLDSMHGGMRSTNPDTMVGTPTFMPREQAMGKAREVDGQSDLWSVGATLFYALTQEYLYDVGSVAEFIQHLMSEPPRPVRTLVPSLPEPVAAVIDQALQHDRQKRWQSAAAMQQALIDAAREAIIEIPPSPSLEGFTPTRTRDSRVSLTDLLPRSDPPPALRNSLHDTETLTATPTPTQGVTSPSRASDYQHTSIHSVPPTEAAAPPSPRARYALLGALALVALVALWVFPRNSSSERLPTSTPAASHPDRAPATERPVPEPPALSASAAVASASAASSASLAPAVPAAPVAAPPASAVRPSPARRPTSPSGAPAGDEDLGTSRY